MNKNYTILYKCYGIGVDNEILDTVLKTEKFQRSKENLKIFKYAFIQIFVGFLNFQTIFVHVTGKTLDVIWLCGYKFGLLFYYSTIRFHQNHGF